MAAPAEYHEMLGSLQSICDGKDKFDRVSALSYVLRVYTFDLFDGDQDKALRFLRFMFS